MITKIIEAFILGVIGGAVPGPMLTAIFTEVLNSGFKKSLRVVGRALLVELAMAVIVLAVISALDIPPAVFYITSILGSGYLLYLASKIWKIDKIGGENGEMFTLSKIFLLTVLNGGFWIFWLTICVPRAFALRQEVAGGHLIFLFSFESGWLLATALLAFIFSRFRSLLLKKNLVSAVFKFFALLLTFFALESLYTGVLFLIN